MNRNVQRYLPVVLSIVGSIGVMATGVLVALRAENANQKIREAKKTNSKKEIIKAFFKGYYPALIAGTATISSIVVGTIISKKVEASLTATAIVLDTTLRKYKGKMKELFGERASMITNSIMKDDYKHLKDDDKVLKKHENLYFEEHIGFFKTTPANLERAVGLTNEKILATQGWSSLREFLKDAKTEVIDNKVIDKVSYDYGWHRDYLNEVYVNNDDSSNNLFIHVNQEPHCDENGVIDYYIITFDKEPIFGVTEEYISRISGYTPENLEYYKMAAERQNEQNLDANALLFDELREQRPTKKKVKTYAKIKND